MSSIHVLTNNGGRIKMVFHIAIPNVNNGRGVNYRTALINSGLGGSTVLPDGDGTGGTISAAEKASLASGALYEVVSDIKCAPSSNAELDALFASTQSAVQASLQNQLSDFGFTRP